MAKKAKIKKPKAAKRPKPGAPFQIVIDFKPKTGIAILRVNGTTTKIRNPAYRIETPIVEDIEATRRGPGYIHLKNSGEITFTLTGRMETKRASA